MSFSIKGKLSQKLSIESGVAKSGNEWKKQSFVLDTDAQYNPLICFQLFGEEKINLLTNFKEGEMIEVFFNLSSKEYNGRYFHNIDAWKIQLRLVNILLSTCLLLCMVILKLKENLVLVQDK